MRIHALPLALFASLSCMVVSGCAQATRETESSEDALSTTHDSAGNDVQVLQIWTRGRLFPVLDARTSHDPGDLEIDASPTNCKLLRTSTWGDWTDDEVDCTDLLNDKLAESGVKAPSLSKSVFTISSRGTERYVDPDACKVFELRVLIKDQALNAPSFAGVGFYTSGGDSYAEKADLVTVGHTTLKTGEAASVLRFTSQALCVSGAHSSTSGNLYRTFEFKPYARFDVVEGSDVSRYRVWESISGNHGVGRSWPGREPAINSVGFDRQGDLLRP